ncbi:7,8-dihydro-8-oxoguanine triphosphatase [Cohnella abietis]|uniref:7,8-dihydro-8-oxoguanine triphosphatase n=2 Tax=Cohnella abietis TaxID=2507935 RepID=A0A3T1CY56_9BACL|nr:7,8-dihydro-8-oxoguanine triphosphatase [Cohnella abietis]
MGRWNGVGGKIEDKETPIESVIRETKEETGISIFEPRYSGQVTWISNGQKTGMYCYIAEVNNEFIYNTPVEVQEGILSWKKLEWVFHPKNKGVLPHLKEFLPIMFSNFSIYEHFCTFENDILVNHELIQLV